MTDIGTGFIRGIEAFGNSRLGALSGTTFKDTGSFLESLVTSFSAGEIKDRFDQLKADIEAATPIVQAIAKRIENQTKTIKTNVQQSITDLQDDDFNLDVAGRVAVRIGTALAAMDQAYTIIAEEVAKKPDGTVDAAIRDGLMDLWNPWAQPWKDLGEGSANLLNAFGSSVLGVDDLVDKLGDVLTLDRAGGQFVLVALLDDLPTANLGAMKLDQVKFEAFLQFSDREVASPTEAEKPELIERNGKWFRGDVAILGIRLRTMLEPGITNDPLLKKVMPGSSDPKTTSHTAVSLDTAQGFYLGDGRGNERAVLPVRFSFPGVELREVALGILRNPDREATGLELTTSIAAKLGDAVGMQVVGAGFIVDMNGVADHHVMFADLPVTPRWPDQVGLRIKAGPVTGGGFIQRVEREYTAPDGTKIKRVEFGGVVQLEILKVGVYAIVVLSPDPFSLVLVMGVRFPTPIELSFGFTLNGVGGIIALDRGIDLEALREGMKTHVIDKMLFPDDPVAEAPQLIDKVAHVFPPREGAFVFGPIAELGWGSQAKFVEIKVGVVLALPDFMFVILGSLRVRVPTKEKPITDIRADVYVAVTEDHLELYARMRDSKIGEIKISGDLGLYIGWNGGGAFELSIGGYHPEYEQLTGQKPRLKDLERITIDISPVKVLKIQIKAYFALTAGSVQLGVRGDLWADFAVASAHAWLQLDMIFVWSPRFLFKVSIDVGVEIEVFGCSFASVQFKGSLEGTTPYKLQGHVRIDVWFLPTFDEDLGPIEWGEKPRPLAPKVDALILAAEAMREDDAWKVELPDHAAQLVTLAQVDDVPGRMAHPLAALEVVQSVVPLGVKISHIGESPVEADMVTVGDPTTSAGQLAAVSEARTAFAPGHYFDVEGEQLLARSGFEDLLGGCRMAAATTPKVGASVDTDVVYHTYVRNPDDRLVLTEFLGAFETISTVFAGTSLAGRAFEQRRNPYQPVTPPDDPVKVAPHGASIVADAVSGADLLSSASMVSGAGALAAFGALSSSEAALVADAAAAAGVPTTRLMVRS
ncbi:DUF6603 domain-containing protein [Agromyces albus]|uniref:DUF6603 domain-containing protein n=1 Tax=Agromyces albus TaxID=205332 RepID=A0A4Q2KS06_9MICO|nr:DUF6603 domain-containing protein [Agromyces albus]RXZ67250.1 hypothetical protein ESP51_18655 [Agromyces albus]